MVSGRSVAEDLVTELESQSWTNLGTNPNIKIGKRYGKIGGNYGVNVYDDDENTEEYMTFANSIVARPQTGIIELWHKNNADRQKMLNDIETILLGSSASYNWKIANIERETEKNNLYKATINIERLLS